MRVITKDPRTIVQTLRERTSDTVDPNTGGRHRFAESELYAIRAEVLAIHRSHSLDNATDVRVLTESITRNGSLLLNVNFLKK